MKSSKINTNFSIYTDSGILSLSSSILTSMTDNGNFPAPTPPLETLSIVINNYSEALALARERGRTQVAMKNDARAELQLTLKTLAAYVNLAAEGNLTIFTSSGFPLAKQPAPTPAITVTQNPVLSDGPNPGEVVVDAGTVKGAKAYQFECTPDPITENSSWLQLTVTDSVDTFKGLIRGKLYWFRVVVIGVRKQKVYSNAVSRIVQ